MQFKAIVTSLALLATAVNALPNNPVTVTVTDTQTVAQPVQTVVSQCNEGNEVCCNVVGDAQSSSVALLAGLLGIVLGDVTGIIGLGCTNIGVSVGNSACNEQAACCTGVQFNGLVNVGCSPINL